MTAKEKKRILARSANILRQKISAADNDAFTPALATSKARPWEAQYGEYCIAIGTIAYPSFALLGLWIAEYGEAGRPDGSSTRCWLGLEFSSWQSAKEFTARVLTLKPVQYYGGTKAKSLVHGKKSTISNWLHTHNLDKVGIESLDGCYYLGKYFGDIVSSSAFAPIKRLIFFGREMVSKAAKAAPPEVKTLRKWGKASLQRVLERPDQAKFRQQLIQVYGRCAISGFAVRNALVAAHIRPFVKGQEQALRNGLLLRADLHMVFDAGLITVRARDGKYVVAVSKQIKNSEYYSTFNGTLLAALPKNPFHRPCPQRLFVHNKQLK